MGATADCARPDGPTSVVGLLLAAGAGRRYGQPKALVPGWVADRCATPRDAGCADVLVVLGSAADEARYLVPSGATPVLAPDWARGLAASLTAGLTAALDGRASLAGGRSTAGRRRLRRRLRSGL